MGEDQRPEGRRTCRSRPQAASSLAVETKKSTAIEIFTHHHKMNDTTTPATKYDAEQIAQELAITAEGRAYYGNALYVAQDMPEIVSSLEHRAAIKRYLEGKTIATDHIRLHEAAAMIRGTWKPEPHCDL